MTTNEVRQMLKEEDENMRTYIQSWKGVKPYDSMGGMWFGSRVMITTIVVTVLWSIFAPEKTQVPVRVCAALVFALAFMGWNFSRLELKSFSEAVVWCEDQRIPDRLLRQTLWTKENIGEVLRFFVPTIVSDILPHEKDQRENSMFPKKHADACQKHAKAKTLLIGKIDAIAPMFNHFKGVDNPLQEAFRLTAEKPTPFAR